MRPMRSPPWCLTLTLASLVFGEEPIGILPGDSLARLGVRATELREPGRQDWVRFLGKTLYLNGAHAVVTHAIDDSTPYVSTAVDVMDRHGIKATIFVATGAGPIAQLWPRLRQAISNGHEIGAHSRTHPLTTGTERSCAETYSPLEVIGPRDDIRAQTGQPYVWSWSYPYGQCAAVSFVRDRLAGAGYIVARDYPDSGNGGSLIPDLQAWDSDPYRAAYTQVAEKSGEAVAAGRTDVASLNAKFDEVYRNRSIYSLVSHPQWVDLDPGGFYEQHLAHVAGHPDIWYVPLGPLYGYQTVRDHTEVQPLKKGRSLGRFAVYNDLDPAVYDMSITLEFWAPPIVQVFANRKQLGERKARMTDRWTGQYYRREKGKLLVTVHPNTILEFE